MEYCIIVACTSDGGIGKDGKIPWDIPEDLAHFKDVTTSVNDPSNVNAVIMGRRTWESLPDASRPLRSRVNFVVSRTLSQDDITGAIVVRSLDQAHAKIREFKAIDKVFVIGGAELYREALYNHRYTKLYMTLVYNNVECDTFFPISGVQYRYSLKDATKDSEKNDWSYTFLTFEQNIE